MATSSKCRFLFVVLLLFSFVSRCLGEKAEARANFAQNIICKNCPKTIALHANDRNNLNNSTYDSGQDPNIRKIQATVDKIILHLSIYTRQIADKIDSTHREKHVIEAIEKVIKNQEAMANDLKNPTFPWFQPVQNNTLKEINELENKVSLLTGNNKQLTDTTNSSIKEKLESIAILNNKLIMLENIIASEKKDIKNVQNMTVNILTYVMKSTQELKALLNRTDIAYDTSMIHSLCDVKVPSSVKINLDAWKDNQIPVADDLDTYLAMKTGCLYTALEQHRNFDLPKLKLDGTPFEWRLAVRTRESLDMGLSWPGEGYSFFVGQELNAITRLSQWGSQETLEKPTPGLLSTNRYVPVYIRIQNGVLTAGSECERVPFFTRDVTAAPGHELSMLFKSWSPTGAKYLYNCPEPTDRS